MIRSTRPTHNQRSGSIILELLVAIFLIGTVSISLILALIYSQKSNVYNSHRQVASRLATQEIETVRSLGYTALTTPYNGNFLSGTTTTVLPSGSGNLQVSYFNSPTNTLKKAVARVSWVEAGHTRSESYTILVGKDGL